MISLDIIPYHSANVSGLRVNNPKKFREVYFEILIKILDHLNPQKPLIINGFPSYKMFFSGPLFADVFTFEPHGSYASGKIAGHDFIGLPFLNRRKGGKDALVMAVKSARKKQITKR